MYSNFVFLDRFLFELSCKNTHMYTNMEQTHTDSNEYPIVAFSKITTIIITYPSLQEQLWQQKYVVLYKREDSFLIHCFI